MPEHEIRDHRKEKLADHINRILSSTESARFAVNYFFVPCCSGKPRWRHRLATSRRRRSRTRVVEGSSKQFTELFLGDTGFADQGAECAFGKLAVIGNGQAPAR